MALIRFRTIHYIENCKLNKDVIYLLKAVTSMFLDIRINFALWKPIRLKRNFLLQTSSETLTYYLSKIFFNALDKFLMNIIVKTIFEINDLANKVNKELFTVMFIYLFIINQLKSVKFNSYDEF